jgi:hypothetical protein
MPFTEPSKYAVGFHHTDWLDNVDRVQAGGANGFNQRFRSLETEFVSIQHVMDNVGLVAKELQAAIESIENRLRGTWTLENLNVPGKLGVGTTAPTAKLSVVGPGATDLGGSILSSTFITSAGTLGSAPNSELALANIGFNAGGNHSSLGVRARRLASGGGWTTSAIGLGMDVDNTVFAGASLWLHHNGGVGLGTAEPQARLHVNDGDVRVTRLAPDDATPSLTKLSLANRRAGGQLAEWSLYTAAVGGGWGVNPNAFEIWEYPASSSRFQLRAGGDTILAPNGGNVGVGRQDGLTARLHVAGNGPVLSLEGTTHSYIQWYPMGREAGRRAYLGFEWENNDNGFTLRNEVGRMHIASAENLYLLPAGRVIVSKAWNGSGNMEIEGNLKINGGGTQLGLENEFHWIMAGGSTPNTSCALGFYYSPKPDETMLLVGQKLHAPKINAGTLEAVNKHFVIDHPLDREGKQLVHSAIEGPEVAVYYRGEARLEQGRARVTLPDYFEALTRKENRTILLTPKFAGDEAVSMLAASEVADGAFTVRALDDRNAGQEFYWEVKAMRSDVDELVTERPKPDASRIAGALDLLNKA